MNSFRLNSSLSQKYDQKNDIKQDVIPNQPMTIPQYLAALWCKPWLRLAVYSFLLILTGLLAQKLLAVLVIVGVAYAISYMLNPLLLWLDGRGINRGLSVAVLLICMLGAFGVLAWMTASQITNFLISLPALLDKLPQFLEDWLKSHQNFPGVQKFQERLMIYAHAKVDALSGDIDPLIRGILDSQSEIMGRLASVLGWLGQAMFVITLAGFFMMDHAMLGNMLLSLIPQSWRPTAELLSRDISESFGAYVRGQLITGLAISFIAAVGLLFLGFPNALALALFTGIAGLIPLVGMVIATVPVLLEAAGLGMKAVVGICVWYFIINQVAFNLVQPAVIGRSSSLSPAGIVVAVLAGGTLGGFVGALLAIPLAMLFQRWVIRYWLDSPAHGGEIHSKIPNSNHEVNHDKIMVISTNTASKDDKTDIQKTNCDVD